MAAQLRRDLAVLDLHGAYPGQVNDRLEPFLYTQYRASTTAVKIIYGGGTGALRERVLTVLRQHPLVATIAEEGGACTVILAL